jgi:hypothetical protein
MERPFELAEIVTECLQTALPLHDRNQHTYLQNTLTALQHKYSEDRRNRRQLSHCGFCANGT